MAAPRKFTDEQRAVLVDLRLRGIPSPEIARRCAAGMTSVALFEISPRTVRDITAKAIRERSLQGRRALEDGDRLRKAWETYLAIVERKLERAERREPSAKELRDLAALFKELFSLEARQSRCSSVSDPSDSGEGGPSETVERMIRYREVEQRRKQLEESDAAHAEPSHNGSEPENGSAEEQPAHETPNGNKPRLSVEALLEKRKADARAEVRAQLDLPPEENAQGRQEQADGGSLHT